MFLYTNKKTVVLGMLSTLPTFCQKGFCTSFYYHQHPKGKLEDLKVLRRSPDHLNNVKIVQGQLQLIMELICFTIYGGCSHFGQVT